MRRKPNKRISKFFRIFVLFILIITVFLFFFLGLKLFIIRIINISTDNTNCIEETLVKNYVNPSGQNLFLINTSKLEDKLKKQFICIKKVSFTKYYPDKINMEILARVAKISFISLQHEATYSAMLINLKEDYASVSAQIKNNPRATFLVDEEGMVFSKDTGNIINIPRVYVFNKDFKTGHSLGKDLISNISRIIEISGNLGLNTYDLFEDDGELLLLSDKQKIVFNLKKDLNLQIASLQLILEKAKIEKENAEFIDLRFDKPIVKYAKR